MNNNKVAPIQVYKECAGQERKSCPAPLKNHVEEQSLRYGSLLRKIVLHDQAEAKIRSVSYGF